MPNFNNIYLVRHGSYEFDTQDLTARGVREAQQAGEQLASSELGEEVVLISSDQPRALNTSNIIAAAINAVVLPSRRLNIIGNDPTGVESLDEMLDLSLADTGAPLRGSGLIVVAHQPLLRVAEPGNSITYGHITHYQPQSWRNPEYNIHEKARLDIALGKVGLR